MNELLEFIKTDNFLIVMMSLILILLIGFIAMIIKLSSLNKKYKEFMKKLGNGTNIEEDLQKYMDKVSNVEKQNEEISKYVKALDEDLTKCIQKIGIVRYNAFENTGSDLSFALAMLDENDNGVVLNGIYSREMSNIYAKPVENGKSGYTLSEEEAQAIQKAMSLDNKVRI